MSEYIFIIGPPIVRNMPASMTAVAGKDFRIKCPVAGFPISSITFEKGELNTSFS